MSRLLSALALALALLAPSASAGSDVVYRATDPNGDYIRLFDKPCANDRVRAGIPPNQREAFMAGEAKIDGKMWGMCWTVISQGIGIIYEDGDRGIVPMQAFKPEVNS